MSNNILVEIHFSDTSTQNVEDKLKRVILHDLEHGKQGKNVNKVVFRQTKHQKIALFSQIGKTQENIDEALTIIRFRRSGRLDLPYRRIQL